MNAATMAPMPGAPSYQLSASTRTIGPSPSWSKLYGGPSSEYMYDLVECSGGGYAIVGYTYSYGAGNADAYLVRTDADGNMLWNKTYGGASYDYGRAVVELSDGFAIAGYSRSYTASYDYWLIRTDLNGNHLWNKTFGGPNTEYGYALVASADGNLTIAGYTYSFGEGSYDFWLVHTNAAGDHLWNQTYGGINSDYCYSLVECSGGGYALAGYTYSYGLGSADAWLIRTDSSGNHLWDQTYGNTSSDRVYSVIECGSGGFALAGRTSSYGCSSGAAWLVRADASGTHLWNQTYDQPDEDRANAVIEYSEGGFVLAGYTGVIPDRKNGGYSDSLLLRTDSSGNMLWNRSLGWESDYDTYSAVVESANGDLVSAGDTESFGAASYDAWLTKTAYPLAFSPALADQTVPFNAPLAYDINTYSWFGEDTWTINDTTHFTVSSTGVVSNALVLATGTYGLRVTVNDTLGHQVSDDFTVTIEPRLFFPIPVILIAFLAVIALVIVLLLYICISRRE